MDALEAISQRHSTSTFKPDPVSREVIEKLLNAAVQAPNHFKVHPWRFVVLQGDALERLGDALADSLRRRVPNAPPEAYQKEREKAFRSPLQIAVGADKPSEPRVMEQENICAAAACVENMLIAAEALGLGAKWRTTGAGLYEPEVLDVLGFADQIIPVAMVFLGYPDHEVELPERPSYEDRTVWM